MMLFYAILVEHLEAAEVDMLLIWSFANAPLPICCSLISLCLAKSRFPPYAKKCNI